jgi:membrane-associated phospholipid phosphatase
VRSPTQPHSAFWAAGATVRWNEIARDLVAKHRTSAPMASRVYALLSVAQYDGLVFAWKEKYRHKRAAPLIKPDVPVTGDPPYPSEHAVVAAASVAVLAYLYPGEAPFLEEKARQHVRSRIDAGASDASDVSAGERLGLEIAQAVILRAQADRSDMKAAVAMPAGTGRWVSSTRSAPIEPAWGGVQPWLMSSPLAFRPPPPPAYRSPQFTVALAEVRRHAEARSAEDARTVALWADGAGSYTPAGRWNRIAADLIAKHRLNEIRGARVLALLNMALMDTGIANWESQYHYGVMRPSQVDPGIVPLVPLPNSPSYPAGHASVSAAGAEVLGYLFPAEREALRATAVEAAKSRVLGGIHYSFDNDAGLTLGRAVAQLVIERSRGDGAP